MRLLLTLLYFLFAMFVYGQDELLPSFHSNHMLATKIKVTAPERDTTNPYKSFIQVAPQDLVFFKPQNVYPFIKLTNQATILNGQTIMELPNNATSIAPFDTLSNMTRFIQGKVFNNSTDTLNVTTHIEGTLIAIQEAKDEKGDWRPIEYWFNDRCGNSFENIPLAPKQFFTFFIPRYYGPFKTELRLRVLLGVKTLTSAEWEGRIDKKQYISPKNARDKDLKIFYSFLS